MLQGNGGEDRLQEILVKSPMHRSVRWELTVLKERLARKTLDIPEGVDLEVRGGNVTVKGPLGALQNDFSHAQVTIQREGAQVSVETPWPNKRKAALVGTIRSHIHNMIVGVTTGFKYKLMTVYAHFPMSVKVQGREVIIENFGGERRPRKARIQGDVKVTVAGDDVTVAGISIEHVSQTAANIQEATKIRKKDHRIFLDGVYVYEKGMDSVA
jgi:large subunit ribosomal protein L6